MTLRNGDGFRIVLAFCSVPASCAARVRLHVHSAVRLPLSAAISNHSLVAHSLLHANRAASPRRLSLTHGRPIMSGGGRLTGRSREVPRVERDAGFGRLCVELTDNQRCSRLSSCCMSFVRTALLLGAGAGWYLQHDTSQQIWDANYQLSSALHQAATGRPLVSQQGTSNRVAWGRHLSMHRTARRSLIFHSVPCTALLAAAAHRREGGHFLACSA